MDRRALLLGLLFAPLVAVAKLFADGLTKPAVVGRIYNLPPGVERPPGIGQPVLPFVYRYRVVDGQVVEIEQVDSTLL